MIGWLDRRVAGPDHSVVLVGVSVRAAGLLMVGCALAEVWSQFPHPVLSALLAGVLVTESALFVWSWLRTGSVTASAMVLDLSTSVGALLLGAYLVSPYGAVGWTDFVFPYTVLISLTVGMNCTRLTTAAGCGLLLGAAHLVAVLAVQHRPATGWPGHLATYVLDAVVAALCARLLRRAGAELERVADDTARAAAAAAAERERVRWARSVHDRVLQTMEALTRGELHGDSPLRDRVQADVVWLRRFVETGRLDLDADLSVGLATAMADVVRSGVEVQLNDAHIRGQDLHLSDGGREALLRGVRAAVTGLARGGEPLTVRATLDGPNLLVGIVGGDVAGLASTELDGIRAALAVVRGGVHVDVLLPCLELRVPRWCGHANDGLVGEETYGASGGCR